MQKTLPDLTDTNAVLTYGSDAQAKVADFSEIALKNLKAKDLGEVSGKITELVTHLKETTEEKPGFFGIFRKPAEALRTRYQKACEAVEKIALSLQGQRDLLMKDIEMLDLLYAMNREQYDTLTDHLNRGKEALDRFREEQILPLRKKAEESNDPVLVQAARDAEEQGNRFEKKLHDLALTRTVSTQMAPQIRLLQNNNTILAEKIQSSIANTIPLWKSQMMLTLGMENSRTAMETQTKVSDITNLLLLRNATQLKETTVAVTREAERGYIDAETLKKTNEILIETLDEMLALREEGRQKRLQTEEELHRLDRELKLRLLGPGAQT